MSEQQVYVVVRQADVGDVEIDGVYADWNDAMARREVLQAEDGAAYVSWVEGNRVLTSEDIIERDMIERGQG